MPNDRASSSATAAVLLPMESWPWPMGILVIVAVHLSDMVQVCGVSYEFTVQQGITARQVGSHVVAFNGFMAARLRQADGSFKGELRQRFSGFVHFKQALQLVLRTFKQGAGRIKMHQRTALQLGKIRKNPATESWTCFVARGLNQSLLHQILESQPGKK